NTAATRVRNLAVFLIPIRGPLPYIAGHITEPVSVCRKRADWRGPFVAVDQKVLVGELALPGVGHHFTTRHKIAAPDELCTVETPTSSELPLGFGRQLLACPACV